MIKADPDDGGLPAAVESGKICAVAGQAQREVREWAGRYSNLFPAKPFDPALFNTVCLCTAFSAPWLTSTELRMTNRAALWSFGVDWRIDYIATSRADVRGIVRDCLAVADGAAPVDDDELLICLADIRDQLALSPAFTRLRQAWLDELGRFLQGMAHEWEWKAEQTRPTVEEYLENADNLGFSFAFVSHWITGGSAVTANIQQVLTASRQAQRVMRLINDQGTYARDVDWGDLNVLMLDVTRQEVQQIMLTLADEFRELSRTLRRDHPELVLYMERQVDFCAGFQEITDYWGTL